MNIKNIRNAAINFIRRNVNYVNQQMTLLERRDETNASRAYQYVQDHFRNDFRTKVNKEGNIRFKSKLSELQELTTNQLKGLQNTLMDYKKTKTGTVRKVQEFKDKMAEIYKKQYESITDKEFNKDTRRIMEDIYNHQNYDRFIEAYGSGAELRLVKKLDPQTVLDLVSEFNDKVPLAHMDERINKELRKARKVDKDRDTSNFTYSNNNFWS